MKKKRSFTIILKGKLMKMKKPKRKAKIMMFHNQDKKYFSKN
jgi:hypothetical protein